MRENGEENKRAKVKPKRRGSNDNDGGGGGGDDNDDDVKIFRAKGATARGSIPTADRKAKRQY